MRFLRYTKSNIQRTPYQAIAATMVMFLTFFVLLVFVMLIVGAHQLLNYYESKPQAIAFFKDSVTENDVQTIEQNLRQTGKVKDLKYVSKEEALKIYQERNKNTPILLELVTSNILPASLEISTNIPSDLKDIGDQMQKEPVVESVLVPEDAIQGLVKATTIIRWVGGVTAGFLTIFSAFLVLMITGFKIRIKRTEIEIMKLLGASNWFVRIPYLLEGVFYGLTGAVLAWGATYGLLWYITPALQNYLDQIPSSVISLPISPVFMLILLAGCSFIGILIGAIGSYGAVKRYLRF
jgi:cell division transport system permease protein